MKFSKDEYTLRNFSKIQHKKWELYIITRIIHLLNDPEIEFVCQQLIKTKNNNRYLTDLCFPALKLYYEIDEVQHSTEHHKISDKIRHREIVDATDFLEKRIRVYDKNNDDRNLKEINDEVDIFIKFVRKRKQEFLSRGKFNPWNYEMKYSPDPHIDRGYIDVKDNVVFLNHRDALRCFGYKGGHYQRAVWKIKGSDKSVWFPKLYENKDWINSLSNDFKIITMKSNIGPKLPKHMWEHKPTMFIVFAHYKNLLGQVVYKFLGEFHLSLEESDTSQAIFIRKKTKIYFDNL